MLNDTLSNTPVPLHPTVKYSHFTGESQGAEWVIEKEDLQDMSPGTVRGLLGVKTESQRHGPVGTVVSSPSPDTSGEL